MIEVDTLYATYAHDPSTAAEAPRAILTDGDLLMISITDTGTRPQGPGCDYHGADHAGKPR